jgi:hypothetical protein
MNSTNSLFSGLEASPTRGKFAILWVQRFPENPFRREKMQQASSGPSSE